MRRRVGWRLLVCLLASVFGFDVVSLPSRTMAAGPGVYDITFGSTESPGLLRLEDHARVDALDLLPDGSIVLAVNGSGGSSPSGLIRLDHSGQRDTSFGGAPEGFIDHSSVYGLARDIDVTSAGGIVVTHGARILRLTPQGSVDPTFTVISASWPFGEFSHLGIDALGRLIVTGIDVFSRPTVARFTSSGTLDTSFASTSDEPGRQLLLGHPQHDPIMLPTGGFFVVGYTPAIPGRLSVQKITESGELDDSFGDGGAVTYTRDAAVTNIALSAAVDPLGRLVVVGNVNGNTLPAQHALILRFSTDGTPDTAFAANADSTAIRIRYPREVEVLPGGQLLLVANFIDSGSIDGIPGAIILNENGAPSSTYGWPEGPISEFTLDEINGTITIGARLDPQGRLLVWGAEPDGFVARIRAPRPVAFAALSPGRVLDSRAEGVTVDGRFMGIGLLPGGTVFELDVGGRAGVPMSASAVALNVTVTEPTASGFLTVFPCGTARPNASSLNFTAGQTVPNAVITKVGVGGKVCLFAQVPTHVIVDTNGYFGADSDFAALSPGRVLDSRAEGVTVDGRFMGIGLLPGGTVFELDVGGRAGVPMSASASAVALNVTVTEPTASGFLTVFPCGTARPNASSLNFTAGQTVPNAVITKVGVGGKVCLFAQVPTHVIVDTNGYFGADSDFAALSPGRVLDSRAEGVTVDGRFMGIGLLPGGTVFELDVGGRAGVPMSASAVALNVTVTEPTASGFLTVFPCGTARPNASSLNFTAGQTVPNAVITKVGVGGKVCLFAQVPTHVIVDTNGYFT